MICPTLSGASTIPWAHASRNVLRHYISQKPQSLRSPPVPPHVPASSPHKSDRAIELRERLSLPDNRTEVRRHNLARVAEAAVFGKAGRGTASRQLDKSRVVSCPEKMRWPVGSIAGTRHFAQPLAMDTAKASAMLKCHRLLLGRTPYI